MRFLPLIKLMSMFLSKPSISFHWDLNFNSEKFFEYDIRMLVCIVGHKTILGRCQLSYLALDYFLPYEIHHFNFFKLWCIIFSRILLDQLAKF